jgi:hypothetical protein
MLLCLSKILKPLTEYQNRFTRLVKIVELSCYSLKNKICLLQETVVLQFVLSIEKYDRGIVMLTVCLVGGNLTPKNNGDFANKLTFKYDVRFYSSFDFESFSGWTNLTSECKVAKYEASCNSSLFTTPEEVYRSNCFNISDQVVDRKSLPDSYLSKIVATYKDFEKNFKLVYV